MGSLFLEYASFPAADFYADKINGFKPDSGDPTSERVFYLLTGSNAHRALRLSYSIEYAERQLKLLVV